MAEWELKIEGYLLDEVIRLLHWLFVMVMVSFGLCWGSSLAPDLFFSTILDRTETRPASEVEVLVFLQELGGGTGQRNLWTG